MANFDANSNQLLVASPEPAFLVPRNSVKVHCHVSLRIVRHLLVLTACPSFEANSNVVGAIMPISTVEAGWEITCAHNDNTIVLGTVRRVLDLSILDRALPPMADDDGTANTSATAQSASVSGMIMVDAAEGVEPIGSKLPDEVPVAFA